MTAVFISYSRTDQAFVSRLHTALDQQGRDAWVDWQGIAPTAAWMDEVRGAIDAADASIFILSPAWLESTVCRQELAHAEERGKRLVPVICKDLSAAEVPEALARLNWVPLKDSDSFDAGVRQLIAGLDTDLDWVRGHTRVLVRAQQWVSGGRDDGALLRGRDLHDAERWLADSASQKSSTVVPLQADFIASSRSAATRRQRLTLGSSFAALIVSIALAIWAFVERGQARSNAAAAESSASAAKFQEGVARRNAELAQEQQRIAERKTREAEIAASQALAAQEEEEKQRRAASTALAEAERQRDAAVEREARASSHALALQANTLRTRSMDRSLTSALRAFQMSPTTTAESAIRFHLDSLQLVSAEPIDGSDRLLVPHADGARMFTSVKNETRIRLVGDSAESVSVSGYLLGVSDDGSVMATISGDQIVRAYRTADGLRVGTFPADMPSVVGFSADGALLALRSESQVRLYDVKSGTQVWSLGVTRDGIADLRFSPNGEYLVIAQVTGPVRLISVKGSTQEALFPCAWPPLIAISPNGRLVALGGRDGSVVLIDAATRRERWRGTPHTGPVRALRFSPDTTQLISTGDPSGAVAFDTTNLSEVPFDSLEARAATGVLAWADDAATVLVKHGRQVTALRYPGGLPLAPIRGHSDDVERGAFSRDGRLLFTTSRDSTVRQWRIADPVNAVSMPMPGGGALRALWLPDESAVVIGGRRGDVIVWDGLSEKGSRVLRHGTDGVLAVAVDRTSRRLAAGGHDGRVVVWSLPIGDVLFDARVSDQPLESVSFGASPDEVAIGDRAGSLRLCKLVAQSCNVVSQLTGGPLSQIEFDVALKQWRAAGFGVVQVWSIDWTPVASYKASNFGVQRLRWHAPTNTLAFAGSGQALKVHGAGQPFQLEGLRTSLNDFAFSPLGDELAVASASVGVRVWSLAPRRVVRTLFGMSGSLTSVSWSPDGRYIAAAGDGEVGVWDAKSGVLMTTFSGPFGRETQVAFSPSGRRLVMAGRDGRAQVVSVARDDLLRAALARVRAISDVLSNSSSWDDLWNFGPEAPAVATGKP